MAKLIVEEGGTRRAFRMGKGVLTVGSGAEARLKLASTDVAEIHFELELSESGVKLRPRPGVVAPKVGGLPAKAELALAPGKKVEVGSARLWVEAEEGETHPPAPAVPRPAPVVTAPVQREPREGGRARRRAEDDEERPGRVPGWLQPVLLVAAVVVVFLLWYRTIKAKAETGTGMATEKMRAAEQAYATANYEDALRELSEIPLDALTPELAERKAALEQEIKAGRVEVDQRIANQSGDRYLDAMLRKYEDAYLQGTPDAAKVRLFLKRCRTFRERWPRHPELDWVQRQEARFSGFVDVNAPPTWADVSWEVKDLTGGAPKNYVAALALLDELLTRVEGKERTEAQNLRDELVKGRPAWAEDRLQQARYEYETKEDPNKAVWWLVHNVAWLGDEALANESARFLVRMPDLAGHLLGYKRDYPDRYQAVMKNAIVASWAQEAGFTP